MEFLFDNPRILFTLLLLAIYACLMLLMALVYWIAGKIKVARTMARLRAATGNQASPQAHGLQPGCDCHSDGTPLGACSCQ